MRYKIVIADDERIICNMLTKLIHTDSLNLEIVGQAYSGESLLSLIQEKKPDIVLTDINMPAINGIEVIRRVQELGYKCSFIAISGYREFDYVYSALKYNVKDYLLKPITEEALNSTLEKVAQQLDAQKHQNQDSINSVWHYYMTTGLDELGTGIATVEALNKTLSTRFSSGPFQGIIIKVDLISNTSEIFESQSFVNSKISDIIMHYLKPICHDLLLIDLQRELRCLINYSPENSTEIQHGLDDIFPQVQSIVATLSGIFTTFCVSAAHTEIGELSQIFHEAETAIIQRLILGTNQIILKMLSRGNVRFELYSLTSYEIFHHKRKTGSGLLPPSAANDSPAPNPLLSPYGTLAASFPPSFFLFYHIFDIFATLSTDRN